MGNRERTGRFFATLDSVARCPQAAIDSVVLICSSASPEGEVRFNDQLSRRRAAAAEALFRSRYRGPVAFRVKALGEGWDELAHLLRASSIDGREKAIDIIGHTPIYIIKGGRIVGGRKKALMDLQGGRLWREMGQSIFPRLRQATLTVHYRVRKAPAVPVVPPADTLVVKEDTLVVAEDTPVVAEDSVPATPVAPLPAVVTPRRHWPPLALKTNLLADAVSVVNLGAELPIGTRWSVAGELYFPWWKDCRHDITVQLFGGIVEGRYWLGDRSARSPLTGFYAGVYGGAGYYDFQLGKLTDGEGVQGEFYIMSGLSAGYAHTIGRHLRLEYAAGVGYLRSDYRKYVPVKDTKYGDIKVREYPWEVKRLSGLLPCRLAVSLVWMLAQEKGGRP